MKTNSRLNENTLCLVLMLVSVDFICLSDFKLKSLKHDQLLLVLCLL